jgi:hypothetical protein
VVAAMWMGSEVVLGGSSTMPAIAGASEEAGAPAWSADKAAVAEPEVAFVAILFAAASVFFGIFPSPLFHLFSHAGRALGGLF